MQKHKKILAGILATMNCCTLLSPTLNTKVRAAKDEIQTLTKSSSDDSTPDKAKDPIKKEKRSYDGPAIINKMKKRQTLLSDYNLKVLDKNLTDSIKKEIEATEKEQEIINLNSSVMLLSDKMDAYLKVVDEKSNDNSGLKSLAVEANEAKKAMGASKEIISRVMPQLRKIKEKSNELIAKRRLESEKYKVYNDASAASMECKFQEASLKSHIKKEETKKSCAVKELAEREKKVINSKMNTPERKKAKRLVESSKKTIEKLEDHIKTSQKKELEIKKNFEDLEKTEAIAKKEYEEATEQSNIVLRELESIRRTEEIMHTLKEKIREMDASLSKLIVKTKVPVQLFRELPQEFTDLIHQRLCMHECSESTMIQLVKFDTKIALPYLEKYGSVANQIYMLYSAMRNDSIFSSVVKDEYPNPILFLNSLFCYISGKYDDYDYIQINKQYGILQNFLFQPQDDKCVSAYLDGSPCVPTSHIIYNPLYSQLLRKYNMSHYLLNNRLRIDNSIIPTLQPFCKGDCYVYLELADKIGAPFFSSDENMFNFKVPISHSVSNEYDLIAVSVRGLDGVEEPFTLIKNENKLELWDKLGNKSIKCGLTNEDVRNLCKERGVISMMYKKRF